eukprot:gene12090-15308_t
MVFAANHDHSYYGRENNDRTFKNKIKLFVRAFSLALVAEAIRSRFLQRIKAQLLLLAMGASTSAECIECEAFLKQGPELDSSEFLQWAEEHKDGDGQN